MPGGLSRGVPVGAAQLGGGQQLPALPRGGVPRLQAVQCAENKETTRRAPRLAEAVLVLGVVEFLKWFATGFGTFFLYNADS